MIARFAARCRPLSTTQVADDFAARCGERPVLLETFVETPCFRGSSYRAANWRYLCETQGRGKGDRTHRVVLPSKGVSVYPLGGLPPGSGVGA